MFQNLIPAYFMKKSLSLQPTINWDGVRLLIYLLTKDFAGTDIPLKGLDQHGEMYIQILLVLHC